MIVRMDRTRHSAVLVQCACGWGRRGFGLFLHDLSSEMGNSLGLGFLGGSIGWGPRASRRRKEGPEEGGGSAEEN